MQGAAEEKARDIKKPAEGAAGKTTSKKWRERKTEIDYRTHPSRSLGLLQLLTKLKSRNRDA